MNLLLRSDSSENDLLAMLNTSKHQTSVSKSIKHLLSVQNVKHFFNPEFLFPNQRSKIWFEYMPQKLHTMGYSRETYFLALAAFESVLSRRKYPNQSLLLLSWACLDLAAKQRQNKTDQINSRRLILPEIRSQWARFKLIRHSLSSDLGKHLDLVLVSDFFRPCFQVIQNLMIAEKPNLVFLENPEDSTLISDLLIASHSKYEIRKFTPACTAISILIIWQHFLNIHLDWLHLVEGLEDFSEESVQKCILVIQTSYFEKGI